MTRGLTHTQLTKVLADIVPTDHQGDLLARLPGRLYDREAGLYRPLAPAALLALDLVPACCAGCDMRVVDAVELASIDPDGAPDAWTMLPHGAGTLHIGRLLADVAKKLAKLYQPRSKKPTSSTVSK